jgi:hypothetical protein
MMGRQLGIFTLRVERSDRARITIIARSEEARGCARSAFACEPSLPMSEGRLPVQNGRAESWSEAVNLA